jgi:hypothetical protein
MLELKTNTAVRVPVGPLLDPTDGITAETALTVTALTVQIYQVKTDGTAVVRTAFSPTASGGDNDMTLVTDSTDAVYDLELTAAQLNFLGNARMCFYDVDGFLVHYYDIQVVSANYFDNKYGATVESVTVSDKTGFSLSAAGIDAVHDEEVDNDGTAISLRGALKLLLSVLTGKSSGGGTVTPVFRDLADTKDRISVTVDANGNRTAVGTRDAT